MNRTCGSAIPAQRSKQLSYRDQLLHELYLQVHLYTRNLHVNKTLRGSPCKNRPLEFRKITEFLHTFCVEEVIHKMNKKRSLWNCSQFKKFFRDYFRTRSKTS